jgi:hypothetical protein
MSLFLSSFCLDLLARDDCNVIGIDWSHMAPTNDYVLAAENSLLVGDYLGAFVSRLVSTAGASQALIHGIGFSLGSHAIGHVGRTVEAITGDKLARVTCECTNSD